MNTYYTKIQSQKGLSEFKELIKKWEALSEHISTRALGIPIILPNLFLVSCSGTGRTHLLKLLSGYLMEKPDLMDFYGDVKYFEFMLNYCDPNEHFSEIQRFMMEVDNAAGFRSEYRGIVYIDIDEWIGHFKEKHFLNFMEYLSDNSDEWLIVLSVSDGKREQVDQMEAFVSAFIRIERIAIEQPTLQELTQYAQKLLGEYGITLLAQTEQMISDSIEELRRSKYFDGYKTVKMLCEDIAYSLYTDGFKKDKALLPADLSKFSKDGEYIQRKIVKIEKFDRIGF